MAAAKKAPAKGRKASKKALRGRMPVKRSINLILIDENKISISKAVPAVILIILLAALFSKFLVADRLIAMSRASGQASSVRSTLDQVTEALREYDGIEDTYAHMTYAGMTQEEMERVDRVKILELVATILPEGDTSKSWSVTGNVLTVEMTGSSLESLNELARQIEESPIVDSCVIATAKKDEQKTGAPLPGQSSGGNQTLAGALEARRQAVESGLVNNMLSAMTSAVQSLQSDEVQARFTIYLCQPPETEETPAPEAPAETAAPQDDIAAPVEASEPEVYSAPEAEPETAAEGEGPDAAEVQKPSRPVRSTQQAEAAPEATAEPQPEATVEATTQPEEVSAP